MLILSNELHVSLGHISAWTTVHTSPRSLLPNCLAKRAKIAPKPPKKLPDTPKKGKAVAAAPKSPVAIKDDSEEDEQSILQVAAPPWSNFLQVHDRI